MRQSDPSIEIIDLALRQAIVKELGIEELRIGRHILRGPDRMKTGELLIQKVWIAEIILSPVTFGCLAYMQSRNGQSVHCAVPGDEGVLTVGPLTFGPEENLLSTDHLCEMDLWSGADAIPLQGARYQLFVATSNLTTAMRISNPKQPKYLAFQQSLLSTMELFEGITNGKQVIEFTRCWRERILSNT